MKPQPPWENESGVLVLRLYKTKKFPDWPKDVNKPHLHADWPRIVLVDLTPDQFKEFDRDPLAFANKYNLYPEQPIKVISAYAKLPRGQGTPQSAGSSGCLGIVIHGVTSAAVFVACPQQ